MAVCGDAAAQDALRVEAQLLMTLCGFRNPGWRLPLWDRQHDGDG